MIANYSTAGAGLRRLMPGLLLVAACTTPRTMPPAEPIPIPAPPGTPVTPDLPPVPERDGPLAIDVVYPDSGQTVATDSTFVFGSVGSGRAQLTINNTPVDVAANGSFLAFVEVPVDGVYRFQATKDGQTQARERRVRVPSERTPPAPGRAQILGGSAYPTGAWAADARDRVEVGFRGTPGGEAFVMLPFGMRVNLVEMRGRVDGEDPARNFQTDPGAAPRSSWARYEGVLPPAILLQARDTGVAQPRLTAQGELVANAPRESWHHDDAVFHLVVGTDTMRQPLRLNLVSIDPLGRVGVASAPSGADRRTWTIRGRPFAAGPFHWFWPDGTRLRVIGQRNDMYRVRLTETLSAWVPVSDVQLLPEGAPPPAANVGGVRFVHYPGYIDMHVPLAEQLPFRVDSDRAMLTLDIYGATSVTNFFQYGKLDPLVERAAWSQPSDDVYRVQIDLTQPVWGYDTFYAPNGDLVLRIRRPPVIDAEQPLRGLLIAVDPGHPPGGAIGPQRFTEAEANLAIALRLRPLLEAAGARVLMTRVDDTAVGLGERPQMATDSNAHILVSVHNNAFPDGVNPFTNNGTSTYYYQPHSVDLAQIALHELLQELGLRDIGLGRADLALVRPTWMPSVLTETSFLMLPRQEAALQNPEVQERIARAHLRALEAFARKRAAAR